MSGAVPLLPVFQFSNNGVPMVNGTVSVYLAGTTTPSNTWQDEAQTTLNTNPIVLDARGEAVIYLDPTLTYKFVLKNAGGVIQWTQDNLSSGVTGASIATSINAITKLVSFSGNGLATQFSFLTAPASENTTNIYINGVYQQKNTYLVAGTVLTFSEAPPFNSTIEVNYV